MWPGMGTDFLLLLERDVDTNGFEPVPIRNKEKRAIPALRGSEHTYQWKTFVVGGDVYL